MPLVARESAIENLARLVEAEVPVMRFDGKLFAAVEPDMPSQQEQIDAVASEVKDLRASFNMLAEDVARCILRQSKPAGFDWNKLTAYLPAARSLIWAASGLLLGGVGTYSATPTQTKEVAGPERVVTVPGPERIIHTKEIVVPSNAAKANLSAVDPKAVAKPLPKE